MKIRTALFEQLICPHCRSRLAQQGASFVCGNCGNVYPVIDGIPILIDEATSSFRISSYQRPEELTKSERSKRALRSLLPKISMNLAARKNYQEFRKILFQATPSPRVLVIGGATPGAGMEDLLKDDRIEFVETDVAIDERTALVCDAHTLPFADETFDGVAVQAVLFYLAEFPQGIREIFRVLKPGGVVYSELPFMEQIVGGAYDFYRFTLRGHEYQFRAFEKISSGISGGPAMATAWSIQYLLLSFSEKNAVRAAMRIFCKATLFWMKYLDLLLVKKRGSVDAAAGTYFLGRRPTAAFAPDAVADEAQVAFTWQPAQGQQPTPARQLQEQYRGLIQTDVRSFR